MSLGERNRVCANSGDSHFSDQQPMSFALAFAQHSTSKHEVGHSVDGPALTGEDLTSATARGAPYLFGAHNAFTDKHTVGPITKVTEDTEPEQSVPGLPQPRRLPSLSTDISEDEGEAKSGPLQVETLGDEHDKKASKGTVRGGSRRGRRSGEHVHSANPKRKQQVSFYSQAHQNLKIKTRTPRRHLQPRKHGGIHLHPPLPPAKRVPRELIRKCQPSTGSWAICSMAISIAGSVSLTISAVPTHCVPAMAA